MDTPSGGVYMRIGGQFTPDAGEVYSDRSGQSLSDPVLSLLSCDGIYSTELSQMIDSELRWPSG